MYRCICDPQAIASQVVILNGISDFNHTLDIVVRLRTLASARREHHIGDILRALDDAANTIEALRGVQNEA